MCELGVWRYARGSAEGDGSSREKWRKGASMQHVDGGHGEVHDGKAMGRKRMRRGACRWWSAVTGDVAQMAAWGKLRKVGHAQG